MKTYILTHKKIDGALVISYDDTGRCMEFKFDCSVEEELWNWIFDNFPAMEHHLKLKSFSNFYISEKPDKIDFKAFWDVYGYKVGNKSRAEKLFNLLSDIEKTQVISSVPRYNSYLLKHPAQEKCYAETYLNQRRWESDFK